MLSRVLGGGSRPVSKLRAVVGSNGSWAGLVCSGCGAAQGGRQQTLC